MARWGLSSCLLAARSVQLMGTLISAILNGFLLVYINANRLGLSNIMLALEVMTCVTLIYTALVLLVQHTGRRHLKSRDTITFAFVVGDVLFSGLTIGLFSIISRSGVPSDCGGLTRSDYKSSDAPDDPSQGYDTVRFGSGDQKGELDRFCSLERGYYFITIAILLSYMASVTLGALRIAEVAFQKKLDERLATANELVRLESKVSRTRSSFLRQSSAPSSPLQEGFHASTPRSPRSFGNMSSSRQAFRESAAASHDQYPTRPSRRTTLPTSPLIPSPISLGGGGGGSSSGSSNAPVDPAREGLLIDQQDTGDSIESVAEAAMITDGYRNPGEEEQHHHHISRSQQQQQQSRGFARSSIMSSAPPPYVPGESSRFMTGHADESNEMRLSDYVKGQTRAQNMKNDDGGL